MAFRKVKHVLVFYAKIFHTPPLFALQFQSNLIRMSLRLITAYLYGFEINYNNCDLAKRGTETGCLLDLNSQPN